MGQGSSPVNVLNSYHSGCTYELIEESGPPHNKAFVVKVEILGVAYTGTGGSKKRAKQAAAASALKSLYNINLSLGMESNTVEPAIVAVDPLEGESGESGMDVVYMNVVYQGVAYNAPSVVLVLNLHLESVKRCWGAGGAEEESLPKSLPESKRPRLAPPKPSVSFQHPVSELVSKHQGAVFNFTGV